MDEKLEKRGSWVKTLLADTRQGIVGFLVALIAVALGGWLTGVGDTNIPLWLVGVLVILAGAALSLVVARYERRVATLDGQLRGMQEGLRGQIESVETSAKERIGEADQRATELESNVTTLREQLRQATEGQVPLTTEAQGLIARMRALQADCEQSLADDAEFASKAQKQALGAIAVEMSEAYGHSPLGREAARLASEGFARLAEIRTVLSQLDPYTQARGRIPV